MMEMNEAQHVTLTHSQVCRRTGLKTAVWIVICNSSSFLVQDVNRSCCVDTAQVVGE